jgi:hypothetical protein
MDANLLKENNVQKRKIGEYVVEILKRLNEELQTAHQEGLREITTSLPIVYDISRMTNQDAQRNIWSEIIQQLEAKNYRVWINFNSKECRLKITWISVDDELKEKAQSKIIRSHISHSI